MSLSDDAVVRRHLVVDVPIERAFATFVDRFGDFKPRSTTCSASRSPTARSSHGWAGTSTTGRPTGTMPMGSRSRL